MSLREEIAHLRSCNDGKSGEAHSLQESINCRNHENGCVRDQIKDVEKSIVREVDEGRNLRIELSKINDAIDKINSDIHCNRSCIESRERDIDGLNKNINDRIGNVDGRNKDISSLEVEIARLKDNISKAEHDQDHLKSRLDDEVERHMRLRKEGDDLSIGGHGLRENIKDLEAQLSHRESQICVMRNEIEKLQKALNASEDCNFNLQEEFSALSRHSDMLHHQNTVISSELEEAVSNDEFVRKELDRRERVCMLQQQNDEQVRHSLHIFHETKTRSPCRRSCN
jgi:chromosome segregation ATPase